jgi:TolB-like protein
MTPVVAVAPFDSHTADPALQPLGAGLAEMITTDLGRISELKLVERAQLGAVLKELELQRTEYVDKSTAADVGKVLGVQYLVTGAVAGVGKELRLDAHVVDVATGQVAFSASATGKADDFFVVEKDVVNALIAGLHVELTARERVLVQQAETTSLPAALAYGSALDAIDLGALDAARDALLTAVAADDHFALASAMLDQVRAESAAAGVKYASAVAAKFVEGEGMIATCAGGGDCQPLAMFVAQLPGVDSKPDQAHERQEFLREVLASKIPDDLHPILGAMSGPRTRETAMVLLSSSLMGTGDYAGTIEICRVFVKKYPESAWFPAMQSMLDGSIAILESQR